MLLNLKGIITFISLLSIVHTAEALTCEQQRADSIFNATSECGPSSCNEYGYCVEYHGNDITRYYNSSATGFYVFTCRLTTSTNGQNYVTHSGIPRHIMDCSINSREESHTVSRVQRSQKNVCGSIVGLETQSLGERVPLVGASFSLEYSSVFSRGRTGAYLILFTGAAVNWK